MRAQFIIIFSNVSQYSDSDSKEIVTDMLQRRSMPKNVKKIVEDGNWTRKSVIFEDLTDQYFKQLPKWSIDDLEAL